MKVLHEISSCRTCHFFCEAYEDSGFCAHSQRKGHGFIDYSNSNLFPSWCPLQKEAETIFDKWVRLPIDPILADLLEERGHTEAAQKLRG